MDKMFPICSNYFEISRDNAGQYGNIQGLLYRIIAS